MPIEFLSSVFDSVVSAGSEVGKVLLDIVGGSPGESTSTSTTALSAEQRALMRMIRQRLGQPGFDTSQLLASTRDRFGEQSSALRQGSMQRLQRAGVSPLQQESVFADLNTQSLRELGGTLADVEFRGASLENDRQQRLLGLLGSLLQGTGTTTTESTFQDPGEGLASGLSALGSEVFKNVFNQSEG